MKNSGIGLLIGGGLLLAGGGFLFIKNFYKHNAVEPADYRTKTGKESKVKYPDPNNPIKFNIPEDYGIGHQRAEQLPDRSWYNRSDSTGAQKGKHKP